MSDILTLPWLLTAPDDFRSRNKLLRQSENPSIMQACQLAQFSLNPSQLEQLGATIARRNGEWLDSGKLRSVKLAIAASHTSKLLAGAMPATALRHRMRLQTYTTEYGQIAQQLLDADTDLAKFAPDFLLLSIDAAALGLDVPQFDEASAKAAVQSALDYVTALRDGAQKNSSATVILHTIPQAPKSLFGNYDACLEGTQRAMTAEFNAQLLAKVVRNDDLLLDLAGLAEVVGTWRWHDPVRWHDAKVPYTLEALPLLADHIARLLAAAKGLARKCLVLDLDNTLWGGVIGDDGVEGICLGQGSSTGEAHVALQSMALYLRTRGIVLAVCSKNEDLAARLPFQQHDEMVLKEDHISVFVANWTDKASNLKSIADTLNIGTDALVFLDDNPAERERVRQELPEVAVPEIGDDAAHYVPLLCAAGYFEALSFGDEDRQRAEMYQANAKRASSMQQLGNVEEYLASLDMVCTIRSFDELGRTRIAQLINKSNQFNLTTQRYTEAEVAAAEKRDTCLAMQIRLTDRFGDNGMISVVIFEKSGADLVCDTWLMSCRVLGRRVEEAALDQAVKAASAMGAERLIGRYIPTAKNVIVAQHFAKLGFSLAKEEADGSTLWVLEIANYKSPSLPMQIESELLLDPQHPAAPLV